MAHKPDKPSQPAVPAHDAAACLAVQPAISITVNFGELQHSGLRALSDRKLNEAQLPEERHLPGSGDLQ